MKYYSVDNKKEKSIYKDYIKSAVWNYGWFVKFSYIFEKILLVVAVILGLLNLINVIFFSHEPIFLLFLIITIGAPYGLSLIFKTVYCEWTIKEYKYRGLEKIGIDKEHFEYSYDSPLSNIRNTYTLNVSDIDHVEYNEKKHELTVFGNIIFNETVQGEIISEKQVDSISLLNIFKKDLKNCFKQLGVTIKEI